MSKRSKHYIYGHSKKGKYREYRWEAKKRKIKFQIDFQDFCNFWQKPCAYCGCPIDTIGIDRLDNSIGYFQSNIVSCCFQCNRSKNKLDVRDFFEWCEKVSKNKGKF